METQSVRSYKRVGNRLFAVPKVMGIADRIAARSAGGIKRCSWNRVDMVKGRARVINNALGRAARKLQPRFGA